jgi:hypothetical protein
MNTVYPDGNNPDRQLIKITFRKPTISSVPRTMGAVRETGFFPAIAFDGFFNHQKKRIKLYTLIVESRFSVSIEN